MQPVNATFSDFDQDDLSDVVELVYGTSTSNPDTDGDGVKDGAEVDQGTNPLDGLAARTGIVASADTPGMAVDVCALNDLAAVADSERGVSVFAINRLNPTIIAQVDTPGRARALACTNNIIAVADDTRGLAIIDISDPPAARIVNQLALGTVQAVAIADGVVYAGLTSGEVVAVDLGSGTILDRLALTGAVQDLAVGGDVLYALTPGQLYSIPLEAGTLQVASQVATPGVAGGSGRRLRLFVGSELLYTSHIQGYNSFSLTDPLNPSLIAAGNTTQFGWKQIVDNGSGTGLAAVGLNTSNDGPHDISLYDLRDPTNTNAFLTTFETPGLAAAVAIYNGLAYVADSNAGLQVLNYRPYDNLGVAPTITLATNFSGNQAEENKPIRLTATVNDDVQVRNVEFYLDGVLVATDGNYPFEQRLLTPPLTQQSSFRLQARATDTGGNATSTTEVTINLVADATPPRVIRRSPAANASMPGGAVTGVAVTFSEPISQATLAADSFQVFSAGPDGALNTADDLLVAATQVYRPENNTFLATFPSALAAGSYRVALSSQITDLAGFPIEATAGWSFTVRDAVRWIRDGSGSWNDATAWSTGTVPQNGDLVVIDRPVGEFTITYSASSGTTSIRSLRSEEAIVISGGTLSIEDTSQINSTLTLSGGTLDGAGELAVTGLFSWTGGTLQGIGSLIVSPGGTLSMSGPVSKLLDGRRLVNNGAATLSDTGQLFLLNGAVFQNQVGATFSFQSDADVLPGGSPASRFENAGTVRKSGGSAETAINVAFNNTGTLAVNVGVLTLQAGGTSTGSTNLAAGSTLRIGAGTHDLSTTSSLSGAGTIEVTGGTTTMQGSYSLTGSTALSGGTLTLNSASAISMPDVTLSGGTLSGSAALSTPTFIWTGGTLQGSGSLTVVPGGTLSMSGTGNKLLDGRRLVNNGTATLSDTGPLFLLRGAVFQNQVGATFSFQSDADVLQGVSPASRFENAGTVRKSGGSAETAINVAFNNSGTLAVEAGTMRFGASLNNTGEINLGATPRVLTIGGSYIQGADGTLNLKLGGLTAGTQHDQLVITGSATLDGTLDVRLVNGFVPATGNSFVLVTYGSRNGTFATINGNGQIYTPTYSTTQLSLTAS